MHERCSALLNRKELPSAIWKDFRRGANNSSAAVKRIIPRQNTSTCCTLLRHVSVLAQIKKIAAKFKHVSYIFPNAQPPWLHVWFREVIYLFIYLHITNIILRINTDYSLKGFNRFLRHWLCFVYEFRPEVLCFEILTLCLKGLMTLSVSQIV